MRNFPQISLLIMCKYIHYMVMTLSGVVLINPDICEAIIDVFFMVNYLASIIGVVMIVQLTFTLLPEAINSSLS